jgi:hypothetical protein
MLPWVSAQLLEETKISLLQLVSTFTAICDRLLRFTTVCTENIVRLKPASFLPGVLEEARYFGLSSVIAELEALCPDALPRDEKPLTRRDVIDVLTRSSCADTLRFQVRHIANQSLLAGLQKVYLPILAELVFLFASSNGVQNNVRLTFNLKPFFTVVEHLYNIVTLFITLNREMSVQIIIAKIISLYKVHL